ncbi:MAG: MBG domain-containing protein [Lachnospiraceae bacterium]
MAGNLPVNENVEITDSQETDSSQDDAQDSSQEDAQDSGQEDAQDSSQDDAQNSAQDDIEDSSQDDAQAEETVTDNTNSDATENDAAMNEGNSGNNDTVEESDLIEEELQSKTSAGSAGLTNMPVNELLYITCAENTDLRWNVNGGALQGNVVHLDNISGKNCHFALYRVYKVNDADEEEYTDEGYYGIKHILSGGTDLYADIENKSKDENKVLHVWEDEDKKVYENEHRQFAFFDAGEDTYGNQCYYIQNRNSGLWLGYSGTPAKNTEIIQTTEANRKKWIITKDVLPKTSDDYAEDLIAYKEGSTEDKEAGTYIEIFKKGTINAINRVGDSENDYANIHYYELGTSAKWLIKWHEEYSAYTIHAVDDEEKDIGKVWDIYGESMSDGALINMWKLEDNAGSDTDKDNKGNRNTTQYWRFIKVGDNYKIQNAKTGKYLTSGSLGYLAQDSDGDEVTIERISGTDKSVNFNYSIDWMNDIPDDVYLSSVNIPGTHDTGTASIKQGDIPKWSWTCCQSYYYGEQLNIGTRSFDVRCNATSDNATASEVKIIHGGETWQCYDRDGTELTLWDILNDSVRFLKNHSSESIVMMVKPDDGSTVGLARAIGGFIKENQEYVYTGEGIPSMGEARGKIVFIRRYEIDTSKYNPADDGLKEEWFGIDLNKWDDYKDAYHSNQNAVRIYDKDDVYVYAQDAYKKDSDDKEKWIAGTMKQTTTGQVPANAWIYNYTSTTGSTGIGFPFRYTRDINPWLYNDKGDGYIDDSRLGMVMLNYIDGQMAKLIYETNSSNSKFYAIKPTAPTTVEVKYGQKLSGATINGQTGDGTWSFDDGDYIPTYNDYKNGKKFKMTYKSKSDGSTLGTAEVSITKFTKKPVQVTVDNKTITYGEATPKLTYSVAANDLVKGDSKEDLGITLTINEQKSSAGLLKAGEYDIKGSGSSNNYNVTFTTAKVTVNKKTVGVNWSDTKKLIYNGESQNVTATLTGVMTGDKCTASVTGGDEVGPSWTGDSANPMEKYTATISSLAGADYGNYQLPADGTSIDYYILRETPDKEEYQFPTKVVLTYGQKLSEATLVGASGEGTFSFWTTEVENPTNWEDLTWDDLNCEDDTILDVGTYSNYIIAYKPENDDTERPVIKKDITITVNKKSVTVTANAKEKTYGDETPELTYTVNAGDLVGNDTTADLGLSLTAGNGDSKLCDADTYQIVKKESASSKYDVTVTFADLTVSKREAEIKWPEESTYTYSGDAVDIKAEVTNQATDGDCTVTVTGGNGINAGEYTAEAVSLSNRNYVFGDNSVKTFDYTIEKATPDVTFPTYVTITYGQYVEAAEINGTSSCEGVFELVRDVADAYEKPLLEVADSGRYLYTLRFIPDDMDNYETVTSSAKVPVEVNPKKITVTADDKQMIYGQVTPEFTWHMDETQLVGEDTAAEFDFELTADGADAKNGRYDAGYYSITCTNTVKKNPNYEIDFKEGGLKVLPKPAMIKWNSTTGIKVGDPEPSAYVTNKAYEDDVCNVVVESDGTESPSWEDDKPASIDAITVYNAEIIGFDGEDSHNYYLAGGDLEIQYIVRRANATDYNMPVCAVMTYGQKISEARMLLAAGDGTFTIVDGDGNAVDDNVELSAGTHDGYQVKYDPNELSAYEDIQIVVRKKAITVNALSAEKTYGEETSLDYELDESSELAFDDKVDDLELSLTAVNVLEEDEPDGNSVNSPAGVYEIQLKECGNTNYDVTLVSSQLYIRQKSVSLEWSDVSNLEYTGEPVSVTAKAKGVLEGDTCDVTVINGNKVEPGSYCALASSLSNSNYILPRDYTQLLKLYTINPAKEPDESGKEPDNNESGKEPNSTEATTEDNSNSKIPVSAIGLSAISQKIAAGEKVQMNVKIIPSNASVKEVTWTTSNAKYATVSKTGKVTAKKAGAGKRVLIIATATDGSGIKAVYGISIMKHAVKKISLKADSKTVKAGKSVTVKATVKTTGKSSVNKKLKWTSSNTEYATVNSKGVVETKKAGKGKKVKITAKATDGTGKKATIKIKIK